MNEAALLERIEKLTQSQEELKTENQKLRFNILKLKETVKLLKLLHFGKKSEKRTQEDTRTMSLFNEAEDTAFSQNDEKQIAEVTETTEVPAHKRKRRKKVGRKPFDQSLPRKVVEYDIPEEEKTCCGKEMTCIGEDVTERLEIVPAQVCVTQERKKKYVCKTCQGLEREDEKGVVTAEGQKHMIPGSMADESLVAWSISEKFEFALPFYRQEIRLNQIGAPVPRATLSNLTITAGQKCKPIYDVLKESIQNGFAINADETRVQVLQEPGRANTSLSWMWVFLGGEEEKKGVVFEYDPSRAHTVPLAFLKDYTGVLQTDDFSGYHTALKKINTISEKKIDHVLCWSHARRYFYKYWETTKDEDADYILKIIKHLFDLEDLRLEHSKKGFLKQRKNRATLLFAELRKFLEKLYPKIPPDMEFGKAISYTLDNWEQLIRYIDYYELTPSNNCAERAIRPFVIGRKNWLFSGSPAGAESSAILYSLVETAKMHELKPFEYLYYIFKKIPYCETEEDYKALLPFNIDPNELHLPGG
jgi:transposase